MVVRGSKHCANEGFSTIIPARENRFRGGHLTHAVLASSEQALIDASKVESSDLYASGLTVNLATAFHACLNASFTLSRFVRWAGIHAGTRLHIVKSKSAVP